MFCRERAKSGRDCPLVAITGTNGKSVFQPPPRPPENAPKRILYVGRLSAEKNLRAIVTATGYVGDRAMVVMVGTGPLQGFHAAHTCIFEHKAGLTFDRYLVVADIAVHLRDLG